MAPLRDQTGHPGGDRPGHLGAGAAVRSLFLATVGLAALALYFLGANEIAILFGGAIIVLLVRFSSELGVAGARWWCGRPADVAPWRVTAVRSARAAGGSGKLCALMAPAVVAPLGSCGDGQGLPAACLRPWGKNVDGLVKKS